MKSSLIISCLSLGASVLVACADEMKELVPPVVATEAPAKPNISDDDLAKVKGIVPEKLLSECLKSFDWNLESAGNNKDFISYDEMWDEYVLPILGKTDLSSEWKAYMYTRFPTLVIKFYLSEHKDDKNAIQALKWMMAQPKVQYDWLHQQIKASLGKRNLSKLIE